MFVGYNQMNSLFNLMPAHLDRVNVEQSVEIFRDLLWCHARKHAVPITKVHISSRVAVCDGGVDAKIDDDINNVSSELLVSAGTSYQLKTGSTFKPWQASQLRKELFGSTNADNCSRVIILQHLGIFAIRMFS